MRTALLVTMIAGCGSGRKPPTPAQLDEVAQLVERATAPDADAERAFSAAVEQAASLTIGTAPCPVKFAIGDEGRVADRMAMWIVARGAEPVKLLAGRVVIVQGALASLPHPAPVERADEGRDLAGRRRRYADLDGSALVARARAFAVEPAAPSLLIQISVALDAEPIDDAKFRGGTILARAYLYDDAERRIVCAGDVVATNSSTVNVWVPKSRARADAPQLTGDLYLNLIRSAEASLRAVSAS